MKRLNKLGIIFVVAIIVAVFNFGIENSSATIDKLEKDFPLNGTEDKAYKDATVFANYNDSEKELNITGYGPIDRDRWLKMAEISGENNGGFGFENWQGEEDFNIRFKASGGNGQKIQFPEDCSSLFAYFDQQIYFEDNGESQVDTSKVNDMNRMFTSCKKFNQKVNFDTSKVTAMNLMFFGCRKFNQEVNFDTSKVTNMREMFRSCKEFNQEVDFDTSKVTNMHAMFGGCEKFNQPVNFDMSMVNNCFWMFRECENLNKPLQFFLPKEVSIAAFIKNTSNLEQLEVEGNINNVIELAYGVKKLKSLKVIAGKNSTIETLRFLNNESESENLEKLEFRGLEAFELKSFGTEYKVWEIDDDTGVITLVPDSERAANESFDKFEDSKHYLVQKALKVEYHGNGNTSGTVPESQSVPNDGSNLKIAQQGELKSKDFEFKGWSTKANVFGVDYDNADKYLPGGELADKNHYNAGVSYSVKSSLDLYAKWLGTISFDANLKEGESLVDGTTAPKDIRGWINQYLKIQETDLSKKDSKGEYGILFWSTNKNGTGENYGKEYGSRAYGLRKNHGSITLYGQWRPKVTFDLNYDGSPENKKNRTNYDYLVKKPTDPSKTGAKFLGWYKEKEYITKWDFEKNKATEPITLYAKWQQDEYKVTFKANGGSPSDQEITVPKAKKIPSDKIPSLKRKGYKFIVWCEDKKLKTPWDFKNNNVDRNITLYAKWKKVSSGGGGGATYHKPDLKTTEIEKEWNSKNNEVEKEWIFDDVLENEWYHDAVYDVAKKGLMKGTREKTFEPKAVTTRAMIITTLFRLSKDPKVEYKHDFPDVPEGMWYTDAVKWGLKNKIILGYKEGNFGPDDTMTREQLVAVIYRYSKYKGYDTVARTNLKVFNDEKEMDDYAIEPFEWVVSTGLIKGVGDNMLAPKDGTIRAELAMLLSRYSDRYNLVIEEMKKNK